MSVTFLNITRAEFLKKKNLYKYMPLENALASLEDKYIWFANPTTWNDPFEKRFIEAKYIVGADEKDYPLKDQIFCTCLTEKATSEAHWNIYSRSEIGISFTFLREELLTHLESISGYDIFIGKVIYKPTKVIEGPIRNALALIKPVDIKSDSIMLNLLLLKRIAFEYEDEIRIIITKKNKTKEKGIKIIYTDTKTLISKIVIHPSVKEHTEKLIKESIKSKYGIMTVFKSNLYNSKSDIKITI